MRINYIKKVEFKSLDNTQYDRRGIIAIFHLLEVPNWQYIQNKALKFLWTLTSMLSDFYFPRTDEEISNGNYSSEGNECWITPHRGGLIYVSHKYWSEEQVRCFRELVLSLAQLHGWEVWIGR
jgi:hypothetical protein